MDYIKRYDPSDPRLGRHVRHDPRSRAFPMHENPSGLVSKRHISNTPVLDQGQLGSCTGNAGTKCLSYEPFWDGVPKDVTLDEDYAVKLYSANTKADDYPGQYPPTDTGSDGVTTASVLKTWGLISGYLHGFSLLSTLTALAATPVILGTEWLEDMFNPNSDGSLQVSGAVAGGHEYVLDELDVENRRVWIQNSWSADWGQDGRAWLSFADLDKLLKAEGDCTVFVPNSAPAPTPQPIDPATAFKDASKVWLQVKHRTKNNTDYEKAVRAYLEGLG